MATRMGASRRTVTASELPPAAASAVHSSSPLLKVQLARTTTRGAGRRTNGGTAGTDASWRTSAGGGAGWQTVTNSSAAARAPRPIDRAGPLEGGSADDDLDPAVLWLTHARAGLHQQVGVAEALDGD